MLIAITTTIVVAALAIYALATLVERFAPEGYEDASGFHYGPEPDRLMSHAASSASAHMMISIVPRSSSSTARNVEDIESRVNG